MSENLEEKSMARRTIILLYALMAVGILLPFEFVWYKR